MKPGHWTKDAPTEDGFYWICDPNTRELTLAQITSDGAGWDVELFYYGRSCEAHWETLHTYRWSEPTFPPLPYDP